MALREPSTLLPPHIRAQLIQATQSPVGDSPNPPLERARRVHEAIERVQSRYPHYFKQEVVA